MAWTLQTLCKLFLMSILLSCYIKLYIYIYIYIQMHCFSGHDLLVQSGAGQQPKAPGARAAAKAEGKDSERFGILIDLHSSAVRSGKTPGTRTQEFLYAACCFALACREEGWHHQDEEWHHRDEWHPGQGRARARTRGGTRVRARETHQTLRALEDEVSQLQ